MRRLLAIPEYRSLLQLLAAAAGMLVALLAAAILVDPYGIFGLRLVPPLVLTNRSEKLAALSSMDPPPQAIILGSSRVFLMDPERVERLTGLRAYNASVSYARPEEYLAITKHLVLDRGIVPQLIVVGANVGELNHEPIDPQTITHPDLRRYLPVSRHQIAKTVLAVLKERFNPRMVRDIFVALIWRARGYPEDRVTFLPNGMQVFDRSLPGNREKIMRTIPTAVRLFAGETTLSEDRKRWFADFIAFAEERGIELRAAVLPMPPASVEVLSRETQYDALREGLLSFLGDLSARHANLHIFDATDVLSYGGDPWAFNDATHPNAETLDRITDWIFADERSLTIGQWPTEPNPY